jgi:hypothetical protein
MMTSIMALNSQIVVGSGHNLEREFFNNNILAERPSCGVLNPMRKRMTLPKTTVTP